MKLVDKKVKRLFSFGCSFTSYSWPTWTEIVSLDLDIPHYNFGLSGAGNSYISNMVCQADALYHFDEDDLIIVSWTNVSREDRWVNRQWITPGNIYTQNIYDENFVNKWVDPVGCLVRDLAYIKLVKNFLENKKCTFHFLSMCNIVEKFNQSSNISIIPDHLVPVYEKLLDFYKSELEFIKPSFFEVLWNNDVYNNKFLVKDKNGSEYFRDGHPYPIEHFEYLKTVFNKHTFKETTIDAVNLSQTNLITFINDMDKFYKKHWAVYELSEELGKKLYYSTKIKSPEPIDRI